MGKKIEAIDASGPLRIYRTPWKGELVLAGRIRRARRFT
jgi:hypothetical protein